jgi:hypothetical protein
MLTFFLSATALVILSAVGAAGLIYVVADWDERRGGS